MLSFWANVTENDVVNYTRSLILQDYMSHLAMDPFHFADQAYNRTGMEPLVISYSGEGRLEEVALDPATHARPLLASLRPAILPGRTVLPDDAIWSWAASPDNGGLTPGGCENDVRAAESVTAPSAKPTMRIYFASVPGILGEESPVAFPAREAYVSVSRGELFLSTEVICAYLSSRCRYFLEDAVHGVPGNDDLTLAPIAGGYHFQLGAVAGELILSCDQVLDDLILFARLQRSIGYLTDIVTIDWKNRPIEMNPAGVLIRFE
ncbi:MAG: hypothetical protein Q4G68_10505 [Planctomycetia bacterium]|nr:hypothetical protein [Planctomycetia bacterium]